MQKSLKFICLCAAVAAPSIVCLPAHAHEHGHAAAPAVEDAPAMSMAPAADAEGKTWICPMHATVAQDHPGRCPICGMDLVLKAPHSHAMSGHESGVTVDAEIQQRLGVRLVTAERRPMAQEIRTYGTVVPNEARLSTVTPKIEGWIRKLPVALVGQQVKAGDILYEIYSPELVQRQREYLELLQRRDRLREATGEATGQAAQVAVSLARERQRTRAKFLQADVGEDVLDEIERTGRVVEVVPVRAERAGYVTKLEVREGAFVSPATPLMSFAVTADVWVKVALHQDELAWLVDGDDVTVTLPRSPMAPVKGRLRFAAPAIDEATRTLPARVLISGSHPELRPGLAVDVQIAAKPHDTLVLPRAAILHGGQGDRVMVAGDNGRFTPVTIMAGRENRDFVEIMEGIGPGTQVVARGQFLLDAAASIEDTAARMRSAP